MSRGLTARQETLLDQTVYLSDMLIEISTSSTDYFYTTGAYAVNIDTGTSGGAQDFTPVNNIVAVDNIPQQNFFSDSRIAITFGADDLDTEISWANTTTVVNIYKMFRSTVDYSKETASDPIFLFNGKLVGKRLNADALNHTLQTEWARDNISNKRFAKVPPVFYTPVGTL